MLNYILERKNYLILVFTLVYLLVFTINAFFQQNFEFLYYTVLMVVLISVVLYLNKFLHLAFFILFNLSLLGFFHLLGGNLYFGPIRLYDFYFVEGFIKYDNIVHTYAMFIVTITLYSLFSDYIDERIRQRYSIFALMLILMALGMGSINELAEFFAVLAFGVTRQVGDYFNNAFDLLFNTIGAIVATIVIYFYRER